LCKQVDLEDISFCKLSVLYSSKPKNWWWASYIWWPCLSCWRCCW